MKKTSVFFLLFVLAVIFIVVFYKYRQFAVNEDYTLFAEISCDPSVEDCFSIDCVPGEDCGTGYYKKVELSAFGAPRCLKENNCEAFVCLDSYNNCSIIHCSKETLEDGEICSNSDSRN